jgi:hypothetical protein
MQLTLAQWVLLGGVDLDTKRISSQKQKILLKRLFNKMKWWKLNERYTDYPLCIWGIEKIK